METTRREFLKTIGVAGAALATGSLSHMADAIKPPAEMPKRKFGKIGWQVSALGIGSAEMLDEQTSLAALNAALDGGVNYIDTAPSYRGSASETYIGKLAKTRRKEYYLATKTLEPGKAGAEREVRESLERLRTDYIDLLQVHSVNSMEELDAALAKGGAVEGLEAMKKAGAIRHIGITGHTRPEVLLAALERYPFESVLVPLSPADFHVSDFAQKLVPEANKRGVAVIAMKVLKGWERARKPSADPADLIRYALSLPVSTAIIGMVRKSEVEANLAAVRDFRPVSAEQKAALEAGAKAYANAQTLWWKAR